MAKPYLRSLGIGGGEVDGTARDRRWTSYSGMPYITLSSKENSRLPELCPRPISRPIVSPDTSRLSCIDHQLTPRLQMYHMLSSVHVSDWPMLQPFRKYNSPFPRFC